jgi:luciferase family oxidoreductase group 1
MLAGPSPEALIGPVAACTQRIRVGSGGVMLPHYSPFNVAETFSVLSSLYPGRIDLGLGRAPGSDAMTMFALQRDRRQASPDDFPQQLVELLGHLHGTLPDDHPFAHLARMLPGRIGGDHLPEVWLLGSSPQSAVWAADLALPYAFADFINPDGVEIAALYRERCADQAQRMAVCVWVVCADTHEEAQRLASSGRMARTLLQRGQLIPVPPPEKALRFLEGERASEDGPAAVPGAFAPGRRRAVVGDPVKVRRELERVAAEYGAEEVMVVTITYDHAARRRSYELIGEAFGLERRSKLPRAA